ncbi:MAG: hypothetical protein BROFUL_01506 [Candidatus Brocadia fulgida]|uniref:Uncharacterized protein n=1 Tax=Candidatus Brocadia fulgida TaxID=380242 RepID=A0A0M2UW30_9BACT|nr:MAG: hypothetical protein BROFUL_01506 [Candidatus Brocadia fulgida]
MDKLCLSVLNYYKSQIVSLWSIVICVPVVTNHEKKFIGG